MKDGYVYVRGWDKFQHPDVARRTGPGTLWIKNYTDLLYNDAYLSLTMEQRGLLHGIWLLVARVGQGRLHAGPIDDLGRPQGPPRLILNQLHAPANRGRRTLEPLIDAGFIALRASKARADRKHIASPEVEGSKEPKKEKRTRARSATRTTISNGDQPHPAEDAPLTREERAVEARRALELVQSRGIKEMP